MNVEQDQKPVEVTEAERLKRDADKRLQYAEAYGANPAAEAPKQD